MGVRRPALLQQPRTNQPKQDHAGRRRHQRRDLAAMQQPEAIGDRADGLAHEEEE